MQRAFFDALRAKLSGPDPDYEWVVRLYSEIRDRIAKLTPNRVDLHQELKEAMDVELFDQMLRNNAFNGADLYRLVHFVFDRLSSLEAPARAESTQRMVQELDDEMAKDTCTFSEFVPLFLRSLLRCRYYIKCMSFDLLVVHVLMCISTVQECA